MMAKIASKLHRMANQEPTYTHVVGGMSPIAQVRTSMPIRRYYKHNNALARGPTPRCTSRAIT